MKTFVVEMTRHILVRVDASSPKKAISKALAGRKSKGWTCRVVSTQSNPFETTEGEYGLLKFENSSELLEVPND